MESLHSGPMTTEPAAPQRPQRWRARSDAGRHRRGRGDRRTGRRRHLCRDRGPITHHRRRDARRWAPGPAARATRCMGHHRHPAAHRPAAQPDPSGRVTQRVRRTGRPRRLHHQADPDRNGRRGHPVIGCRQKRRRVHPDLRASARSGRHESHGGSPTTPSPSTATRTGSTVTLTSIGDGPPRGN